MRGGKSGGMDRRGINDGRSDRQVSLASFCFVLITSGVTTTCSDTPQKSILALFQLYSEGVQP